MKNWRQVLSRTLMPALLIAGICGGVQTANAGGFLWISAPDWSYSAAAAASPIGTAYFWGLSAGVNSFSFAYAFSDDGAGDAAYAFAEASANGLGGVGAINVSGLADPWAGIGIDTSLIDPSDHTLFPSSKPGSDPLSSGYTVDGTNGINFTSESSSELNGLDGLQAFVYTGGTDLASLEAAFGAGDSGDNTSTGDYSDVNSLMFQLSSTLIPLDDLNLDPSSLSTLNFTENTGSIGRGEVILVGEGEVATPEPAPAILLAGGLLVLFGVRRFRTA